MKTLINPWFMGAIGIWVIVFTSRQLEEPIPYINSYLTDVAAVPVIANLGLWFQRRIIIKNDYYVLSPWQIMLITVSLALLFELILPRYNKMYTADVADVFCYSIGGLFFYRIMNKPIRNC